MYRTHIRDEPARPDPTRPDPAPPGPTLTLFDSLFLSWVKRYEIETYT